MSKKAIVMNIWRKLLNKKTKGMFIVNKRTGKIRKVDPVSHRDQNDQAWDDFDFRSYCAAKKYLKEHGKDTK